MLRRRILEKIFKFKANKETFSFEYGVKGPAITSVENGTYIGINQAFQTINNVSWYKLTGVSSPKTYPIGYNKNKPNNVAQTLEGAYVNICTYNFKTTAANQQVVFHFKASCESPNDYLGATKLDNTDIWNLAVKVTGTQEKAYTYTVATPGDHFIKVYYYQHNDGVKSNSNEGYFRMDPYTITKYDWTYTDPVPQSVALTSYYGWTVKSKPSWIKISDTNNGNFDNLTSLASNLSGIKTVYIYAKGNQYAKRTGEIVLVEKYGTQQVTLSVSQEANPHPHDILTSHDALQFPQVDTYNGTVLRSSNIGYELVGNNKITVTNVSSGLTVSPIEDQATMISQTGSSSGPRTLYISNNAASNTNNSFRVNALIQGNNTINYYKTIAINNERSYCYCDCNLFDKCGCDSADKASFQRKVDSSCESNNCSSHSNQTCNPHCDAYGGAGCSSHTTCSCNCQSQTPEPRNCTCHTGNTVEPRNCTCHKGNTVETRSCTCHAGNTVETRNCTCHTGNTVETKNCTCHKGNTVETRSCTCHSGNKVETRSCTCHSGNKVATVSCTCNSGNKPITTTCTCNAGNKPATQSCTCHSGNKAATVSCTCNAGNKAATVSCTCNAGNTPASSGCGCHSGNTATTTTCTCHYGNTAQSTTCTCHYGNTALSFTCTYDVMWCQCNSSYSCGYNCSCNSSDNIYNDSDHHPCTSHVCQYDANYQYATPCGNDTCYHNCYHNTSTFKTTCSSNQCVTNDQDNSSGACNCWNYWCRSNLVTLTKACSTNGCTRVGTYTTACTTYGCTRVGTYTTACSTNGCTVVGTHTTACSTNGCTAVGTYTVSCPANACTAVGTYTTACSTNGCTAVGTYTTACSANACTVVGNYTVACTTYGCTVVGNYTVACTTNACTVVGNYTVACTTYGCNIVGNYTVPCTTYGCNIVGNYTVPCTTYACNIVGNYTVPCTTYNCNIVGNYTVACPTYNCSKYYASSCSCNVKSWYPHCDCHFFCQCDGHYPGCESQTSRLPYTSKCTSYSAHP